MIEEKTWRYDASVIIPAFNCEKSIQSCVQSALLQDSLFATEIIVVNDCSTDHTHVLLEAMQEERLRVIHLPRCLGVAHARNIGATAAQGRYLIFLDSDDQLAPGAVQALMQATEGGTYELVEGSYRVLSSCMEAIHQQANEILYLRADRYRISGFFWGKVILRERYQACNVPDACAYEDFFVHAVLLPMCISVRCIKEIVYIHTLSGHSLSAMLRLDRRVLDTAVIIHEALRMRDKLSIATDLSFYIFFLQISGPIAFDRVKNQSLEVQRELFQALRALWLELDAALPVASVLKGAPVYIDSAFCKASFPLWAKYSKCTRKSQPFLPVRPVPSQIEPMEAEAAENMPIVFAANRAFLPVTAVALRSIQATTSSPLEVVVLHHGISTYERSRFCNCFDKRISIRFYDMTPWLAQHKLQTPGRKHLSSETYFRLIIPYIFSPAYTKALYLDGDILVREDITKLFAMLPPDKLLAAAPDICGIAEYFAPESAKKMYRDAMFPKQNPASYFIAGVMVMNLPLFRRRIAVEQLLDEAEKPTWQQQDQDILNKLCMENVQLLPTRWDMVPDYGCNHFLPMKLREADQAAQADPAIVHFGGGRRKPWKTLEVPYADSFWEYTHTLPYYNKKLHRMLNRKR